MYMSAHNEVLLGLSQLLDTLAYTIYIFFIFYFLYFFEYYFNLVSFNNSTQQQTLGIKGVIYASKNCSIPTNNK